VEGDGVGENTGKNSAEDRPGVLQSSLYCARQAGYLEEDSGIHFPLGVRKAASSEKGSERREKVDLVEESGVIQLPISGVGDP